MVAINKHSRQQVVRLPTLDNVQRSSFYVDVYNRGQTPFMFTATPEAPWLRVVPARGRDAGLPLTGRPGAASHGLPGRGGREAAAARGGDADGGLEAGAHRARRRRGGRSEAHGPPLHRWRVAAPGARRLTRAVGRRRSLERGPARRGHRDRGGGRPLRRALRRGARNDRRGRAALAGSAFPGIRLNRATPTGQPLREGLGAHTAPAPGRPQPRPRGRLAPDAPAAAARPRPRRAPAHRHGVARLARDHHGPDLRAARRGRVPRGTVRRARAAGLLARIARPARPHPRLGE